MVKRKGGEDCYLILGDGGEAEKWCSRRPDRRDGLDEASLLMTLVISFFAYVRALMMLLDLPENPP